MQSCHGHKIFNLALNRILSSVKIEVQQLTDTLKKHTQKHTHINNTHANGQNTFRMTFLDIVHSYIQLQKKN